MGHAIEVAVNRTIKGIVTLVEQPFPLQEIYLNVTVYQNKGGADIILLQKMACYVLCKLHLFPRTKT